MIFIDTSVLVAALQPTQPHYRASKSLAASFAREESAISNHAMAELYATVTAIPPPLRLSPLVAAAAVETYLQHVTPITLTSEDYLDTLHAAATLGHISGTIYDALHLACARKINATHIYTWNVKHFRSLAPDLSDRIHTP